MFRNALILPRPTVAASGRSGQSVIGLLVLGSLVGCLAQAVPELTSEVDEPGLVRAFRHLAVSAERGSAETGPGPARVRLHEGLRDQHWIELNIAADVRYRAVREHLDDLGNGDFVWTGRVENQALSRVTFSVRDGVGVGTIVLATEEATERYVLQPTASGNSWLLAADEGGVGDGDPVSPPGLPVGDGEPPATAQNPAIVDVMVLYTPATRGIYGESGIQAKINEAIAYSNLGYQNSGVYVTLNLVYMGEVNYTETGHQSDAIDAMRSPWDGKMDEVPGLRDQYAADLVTLISQDSDACGLSYVMTVVSTGFADYAFNVVFSGCLNSTALTYPHELGHMFGCQHDRTNASFPGAYPYSYGYRLCPQPNPPPNPPTFRTIMSYDCGGVTRINYYSTPDITYEGNPIGVSHTDPLNAAENVLSINNTAHTVQNFRLALAAPPAAPTGLAAVATAFNSVTLSWTDNAIDETAYKVERSPDGSQWVETALLPADTVSYVDTTVNGSTTYCYRVRAFNSSGYSGYAGPVSVTTPAGPPAAPTGLTATAASSSQMNLAWVDNANNETGFKLERSLDGVTFTLITTVGADVTTYQDTGLAAGTSYMYRVRATNGGGGSAYSNTASATTLANPPAAPTGLTATASSSSQIDLAWVDGANNETGFKLERSLDGVTFTLITTVGADVTTYQDTGLPVGTSYTYRVRATNSGGDSACSNTASATTLGDPPAAPTGLTATASSSSQINLTWVDNANNETGFKLERSLDGVNFTLITTVGADVTTYQDTGLAAGTSYTYRVRATNGGGDSACSNTASATTLGNPPAAPTWLTATASSSSQINLTWVDNANNETGFKLERSLDGVNFTLITTVGVNVTTYQDTGLAAGTSYTYRVRATNSGGDSAYSNTAGATTLWNPPAAPTWLTATAVSSSQINLTWVDNANNETGFKLERSLDGVNFTLITTVGADVTTYQDTGLAAGTSYTYRVRATNSGGDSACSNTASATTLGNPPAAPTWLTATAASSSQINLTWVDNANNETGFKLERSLDGVTFALITTVGVNVTTYQDTGLAAGTSYTYRVRATNGGGDSAGSNTASATTTASSIPSPSGLTAVAVSFGVVTLSWSDNSTQEDGFEIQRASASEPWAPVASVGANLTTYRDAGLTPDTLYLYRVLAVSGLTASPPSSVASVAMPPYQPPTETLTFTSLTAEDGYLLESSETSNIGGAFKAGLTASDALRVGDDSRDKQYKSIISFDTSALPAGASPVSASLRIRLGKVSGTSPFQTHGPCRVDLQGGTGFGGSPALAKSDFEASASATGIATLSDPGGVGGWAEGTVAPSALAYLNPSGRTQFRVYCALDDNDDAGTDYAGFYSGGGPVGSRPELTVAVEASPRLPAPPAGLIARPVSVTQIGLNWSDAAANELGFKLDRSLDGADWVEIAGLIANATTYTDSGLVEGVPYFYRVRSYNDLGYSAYSGVASTAPSNPPIVVKFTSIKAEDGYLLESSETSNAGGSFKAGSTASDALRVGDDNSDRQYKSVISFDTASLPDNAVVVSATLRIKLGKLSGTNPFLTHGPLLVDLKSGTGFGGAAALAAADFQAPADATAVASLSTVTAVAQWSEGLLGAGALDLINLTGRTQFRLYYPLDDNDDRGVDYAGFYSGGASAGSQPELIVEYVVAPTAPDAPSGLTARPASPTQIELTWTDNADNEDGFELDRSSQAVPWGLIERLDRDAVGYTDVGLEAGTTYSYRLRAFNEVGVSADSTTASAAPGNPPRTLVLASVKAEDGYLLESAEDSEVGGSCKAGSTASDALRVGDDSRDRQYRSVVSFDTSPIPVEATIVAATLRLKLGKVSGTDPSQTHGECVVDIKSGNGFGDSPLLANTDFEAPADARGVAALVGTDAVGGWAEAALDPLALGYIDLTGRTQFRLYFDLDDNDDAGTDFAGYYSGGGSAGSRPELVIEYVVAPAPQNVQAEREPATGAAAASQPRET